MRPLRALIGALVAGVLVVLSVGLTGSPASAHASLVSTDPGDGSVVAALPEQVVLTFNEPVRLDGADAVQGFAADGGDWEVEAVARDAAVVVTPVGDPGTGTVVLSWRVVSEDGHEVTGALTFTIGSATAAGPVAPPEAPAATVAATWVAWGVLASALAVLAVLAVLGAAVPARAGLWYAAFAAAVLLGPLERLRAEGRGLDGLADWLAWLDGLADGRALLLIGAAVLAAFLVAARRPVVAGLLGGGVVLTMAVALVVEPATPEPPAAPVAASEPSGSDGAAEQSADLGDAGSVTVTLAAGEGRSHRLEVRLTDPDGAPLRPFAAPTVGLASTDIDLGEPALRRTGAGEYRAEVTIPRDGEWTVRVSVRVDEFTNPVADVPVLVG